VVNPITWFDKAMKLRSKCEGIYEQKIEIYLLSEQTLTPLDRVQAICDIKILARE